MEVKEYKAGQAVVSEGAPNDHFFVILKGQVEVFQKSKGIRVLKEGDVFGLENFYLDRLYTTEVRTITSARIAAYHTSLIEDIIQNRPQLVERILKSVMAQLEQTTQVAEENIPLESLVDLNERIYHDGEVIIEEGTTGVDIYKLVESEGGLLVTKDGREVGRIIQQGEYFGEMSSLLHQERTASVISIGRSVVQVFPGENLEATLAAYPSLAKKVIDTLASRLADANKRIAQISRKDSS
jgi:CRP-like cAMP-binding protein